MSKKLYEESYIQSIASAIREKNESSALYTTAQMARLIKALPGNQRLQEKTFIENGTFYPDNGYTGFSHVNIAIRPTEDTFSFYTNTIISTQDIETLDYTITARHGGGRKSNSTLTVLDLISYLSNINYQSSAEVKTNAN